MKRSEWIELAAKAACAQKGIKIALEILESADTDLMEVRMMCEEEVNQNAKDNPQRPT